MTMIAKNTTAKNKTTAKAKSAKKPKASKSEAKAKKMSALDAAAKVLSEKGVAMTCQELIGVMVAKGYWSSPNGKTPEATLSSAIQREIASKGRESRFKKTAPGRFAATGKASVTEPEVIVPVPTPPKPKTSKKGKTKQKDSPAAAEPVEISDGTPGPESVAELFKI
jgi:hypothetical protein